MGAKIKMERQASLCGDAVTLDAVVADAVPINEHWDYIVTMQPTSPTRVITLDHAIEYTVNNGLDTVISAINSLIYPGRESERRFLTIKND